MSAPPQTIVIKVGTSSLVRIEKGAINISALSLLCETVRNLKEQGHKVVLVSSGAVGVGCQRLGLATRPKELPKRQALAAAGQVHLMRYYDDFFSAIGVTCAQVMLTLDNLAELSQYTNTRSTFQELFAYGVVPVVNENDTVAVEELHFGDNDTLSAKVATAVRADWLFLLTDVDALCTSNPLRDPHARPIREVHDIAQLEVNTETSSSEWGTGGMSTKLTAARIATAAGCNTVICRASRPDNIEKILEGALIGTVFYHHPKALKGRKRWILMVPSKGQLWMDDGAVRAVQQRGKSLFSAGITRVAGEFNAQDAVQLCDSCGRPFAQGLCNYASADVVKLKGKQSHDIRAVLGFCGSKEVVHRDNISMLALRNPPMDATTPAPPHHVMDLSDGDAAEERSHNGASSSGLGRLDSGDSEGNAAAMGLAVATVAGGAAAVAEGRVRRENWEPDSALSPRGDSVTSLSQDFEAPSSYPQGLVGLPTRPPQQSRALARSTSEDSPNPLPSPASGFRARTSTAAQPPPPPPGGSSTLQVEIPESAAGSTSPSARGSKPASPIPEELHGVISSDVASAALMSSQGPIREATEADIAARRAIIAAAKAGKVQDSSPSQVQPALGHPPALARQPAVAPADVVVPSPASGSAISGTAVAAGLGSRSNSLSEGKEDVGSQAQQTPGEQAAGSVHPDSDVSVAAVGSSAASTSPQHASSSSTVSPRLGATESSNGRGWPRAGHRLSDHSAEAARENYRPLSTAAGTSQVMQRPAPARSMYTPMRNHEHARARRSLDGNSPGLSPQSSASPLSTQPSETGSPAAAAKSQDVVSQGISQAGLKSSPWTASSLEASPSSGMASAGQHSSPVGVQARLAILREREGADGTRGVGSSAAKRVTFQTDTWLSDLRTAIEEEKNIDSGRGSKHRSYVAGITEEGWLPR